MSLVDGMKEALSCWASGVSVVTTNAHGMLYGLTVSSFSSLSLDPPLVLVCLSTQNRMPGMIDAARSFAVSILAEGQEEASRYFARAGRVPTPDFVEIEGEWTRSGYPVVKDATAWIVCDVHHMIPEGDHTIVMGRVRETSARPELRPLVYYRRKYHTLDG
jgi:flavin reductase (DIM6/NTAB) family NADH-FMN oxidoreductase RutF